MYHTSLDILSNPTCCLTQLNEAMKTIKVRIKYVWMTECVTLKLILCWKWAFFIYIHILFGPWYVIWSIWLSVFGINCNKFKLGNLFGINEWVNQSFMFISDHFFVFFGSIQPNRRYLVPGSFCLKEFYLLHCRIKAPTATNKSTNCAYKLYSLRFVNFIMLHPLP